MQKVRVKLRKQADNSYDILIGSGLLSKVPSDLKKSKLGNKYAIITDTNVEKLYAKDFLRNFVMNRLDTYLLRFNAGEQQKNRQTKAYLEDELIDFNFTRDSVVIALGGGVVGDIAGFVAATFNRGIPYVQVPTTLLAMVDSSIGGKVAIDHPLGKNLVGAFHQPKKVFIDLDILKTLPKREILNGLAEIIKHAVIADKEFFGFLDKNMEKILSADSKLMEKTIKRACEIKARVVEADEKESGLRKILNFGHTIGHAVEALTNFQISHGEAVSIGMVKEAQLAKELELISQKDVDKIKAILEKAGASTKLPIGIRHKDIIKKTLLDKKVRGGKVEYSLPLRIGKVKHGIPVPDKIVSKVIK
ncbi:3-dehydroquinate synthase [Candidatus Woesearchaeota archaeon]|nr:3-dehydroquinate synthase [Candidatus Woesearchaeota archaeon]